MMVIQMKSDLRLEEENQNQILLQIQMPLLQEQKVVGVALDLLQSIIFLTQQFSKEPFTQWLQLERLKVLHFKIVHNQYCFLSKKT